MFSIRAVARGIRNFPHQVGCDCQVDQRIRHVEIKSQGVQGREKDIRGYGRKEGGHRGHEDDESLFVLREDRIVQLRLRRRKSMEFDVSLRLVCSERPFNFRSL